MRFHVKHILIATAGIALLLSAAMVVLTPFLRLSREIDAAQQRIINEFDHSAIRDAAITLLSDPTNRLIDIPDLPEAIAKTKPQYVYVTDGTVLIEYGGGFAHYGLLIDPNNRQEVNAANMPNGVYYEEKKLMENVYFYETE